MNSIAMAMAASVSRNLATTILSSSLQSSNMDRTAWRSEFIQGMAKRGEEFVILLDIAAVFACDARILVGEAEQEAAPAQSR